MKKKASVLILLTLSILACASMIEKKGDTIVINIWKPLEDILKNIWKELTEKQIDTRDKALEKYGLEGIRQGLIIEPPVITPEVVKPGDKIEQKVQFALLAPEKGKCFKVLETVAISNDKETTELIKRETEKTQGIHLSTIKFIIPKDLPPGEYKLITTINTGEQEKTVIGIFNVEKMF